MKDNPPKNKAELKPEIMTKQVSEKVKNKQEVAEIDGSTYLRH